MKTEFNVERVCERVHLCIVDAPDDLGEPLIEVRNGSIYVSFPQYQPLAVQSAANEATSGTAESIGTSGIAEVAAATRSKTDEFRGLLDAAVAEKPKRPRK